MTPFPFITSWPWGKPALKISDPDQSRMSYSNQTYFNSSRLQDPSEFISSMLPFRPLQNVRLQIFGTNFSSLHSSSEGMGTAKVTPALPTHGHKNSFSVFCFFYQCSQVQCCFCGPKLQEAWLFPLEAKSIVRSYSWFFLIMISELSLTKDLMCLDNVAEIVLASLLFLSVWIV